MALLATPPDKTLDELDADESDAGLPPDRRRARMKDVLRLEARVQALAGEVALLKGIAEASRSRLTREQFAGHVMPAFAAAGTKPAFMRDVAEVAWEQYLAFCEGKPRVGISPQKPPEPRAPVGPMGGLAIPVVTETVGLAPTA